VIRCRIGRRSGVMQITGKCNRCNCVCVCSGDTLKGVRGHAAHRFRRGVSMPDVGTVLVVDSDEKSRETVFANAVKHGEIPIACSSCKEAKSFLAEHHFKVLFCGDNLSDGEYAEVIRAAKPIPVIVLSRFAEWGLYIAALQAGAFDCIVCPPTSPSSIASCRRRYTRKYSL